MTTTDLRTLVARMADELDHDRQCLMDDRRLTHPLAVEARALLAQPEPQAAPLKERPDFVAGYREGLADGRREARAALAEPQPPTPAEGEVAELVAEIRHFLAGYGQMRGLDPENIYSIHRGHEMEAHITVSKLTRAADLLERLASPACLVLKPSPELIEAFQEGLKEPGVVVPMQPGKHLAASAWQPIDTAPRDGTEILASDLDCIDIVSWTASWPCGHWENREWQHRWPCHWQPLPDHPETSLSAV